MRRLGVLTELLKMKNEINKIINLIKNIDEVKNLEYLAYKKLHFSQTDLSTKIAKSSDLDDEIEENIKVINSYVLLINTAFKKELEIK